jgi:non-heme chloroperoxidase
LRNSFRPSQEIRTLRTYWRQRQDPVRSTGRHIQRMQKALSQMNIQLANDLPAGPFYGYNRPGAKLSQAVISNWWRQGMMGGAKAHYDGIVAFSQTDFTEDLKKITVPVLVMHGDDD